jgi:hypothetical protein
VGPFGLVALRKKTSLLRQGLSPEALRVVAENATKAF